MTTQDSADEETTRVLSFVSKGDASGLSLLDAKSNAQDIAQSATLFSASGALEPPYAPDALNRLFEHSNSLRQNIDAYAVNIDGFGYRFEPMIDFDAPDADQRIASAVEDLRSRKFATDPSAPPPTPPTPEEIAEFKAEMTVLMREERGRLERFFDQCCDDMSFSTLRRRTRTDLEKEGNAYWEILRNGKGEVAEFVYLPSYTMRLTGLDRETSPARVKRRTSDFGFEVFEKSKRFRRYVQVVEGQSVYFKEFGDLRILGKKTGKVFASIADMQAAKDEEANEVLHFRIHTSRSPYGIPRWIGNLPSVWGSRQAEEVNAAYFDNKGVPPLAILVSGGRLHDGSFEKIREHINGEVKGRNNFHNILLIEAESVGGGGTLDGSGGGGGNVKIELKPLTDAQQKDGLFMQYDERNMDKVGMAFRLPRLLRGDIRDFNRASAEAALEFAEQQVFQPEREEFDFLMNRRVMVDIGARFWEFKSMGPTLSDPKELAEIIKLLMDAGVLTPEEGRELAEGVFGKELKNITLPWTQQPFPMTVAGLVNQGSNPSVPWTGDDAALGAMAGFGDLNGDGTDDMPPEITRTALATVITVNEARGRRLGPKMLADGTPDPDGNLTIAEFQAKIAMSLQVAAGQQPDPNAAALQALLAQKRRGTASSTDIARGLLKLRDDVRAAQQEAVLVDFEKKKLEQMKADGELTPEVIERLMGTKVE